MKNYTPEPCGVCGVWLNTIDEYEAHWRIDSKQLTRCKNRWDKNGVVREDINIKI